MEIFLPLLKLETQRNAKANNKFQKLFLTYAVTISILDTQIVITNQ